MRTPMSPAQAIRLEHVDLERRTLHVATAKGDRPFDLPLSGYLVDLLKARIAEKELFLQEKIRETRMAGNHSETEKLEAQLATELRRLREDCEEKKLKLRASFGK